MSRFKPRPVKPIVVERVNDELLKKSEELILKEIKDTQNKELEGAYYMFKSQPKKDRRMLILTLAKTVSEDRIKRLEKEKTESLSKLNSINIINDNV